MERQKVFFYALLFSSKKMTNVKIKRGGKISIEHEPRKSLTNDSLFLKAIPCFQKYRNWSISTSAAHKQRPSLSVHTLNYSN